VARSRGSAGRTPAVSERPSASLPRPPPAVTTDST
jgi:hypothetical protein